GTFRSPSNFAVDSRPVAVAVADVDGDGKPDLLTANFSGYTTSLLLGDGDGTFNPDQESVTGPRPAALAVGDVNGDGVPDVVAANFGGTTDRAAQRGRP